jgi:hypothetical protein
MGNAVVGDTVSATATCATGNMISGGASVQNPEPKKKVAAVLESRQTGTDTWTATAVMVATPGAGSTPSITAYATCVS